MFQCLVSSVPNGAVGVIIKVDEKVRRGGEASDSLRKSSPRFSFALWIMNKQLKSYIQNA